MKIKSTVLLVAAALALSACTKSENTDAAAADAAAAADQAAAAAGDAATAAGDAAAAAGDAAAAATADAAAAATAAASDAAAATEAAATDALRELLPGTTTLVVAHRPSTVALADQVAVLEGGKITATGTHSELLASNAHYRYVLTAMETEHPLPASLEAEEVNR